MSLKRKESAWEKLEVGLTALLRLSGTVSRGTPPKKRNICTCEPIQSGSVCVKVASAYV